MNVVGEAVLAAVDGLGVLCSVFDSLYERVALVPV
jgi:hypothetical protein